MSLWTEHGKMESIHLQGLGRVPAVRAKDLKPGDKLHWNYTWAEYEVVSVEPKGKSILITERHIESGRTHTRRKLADTLIGCSPD
jgi:hypothetical protein